MVKANKLKHKKFKNKKAVKAMLKKFEKNKSETEAYLKAVKSGISNLKRDIREWDNNTLEIKTPLTKLK